MTSRPFGLFCPTSKATEVLMPRWTVQILSELWDGSTRFNEIRRGLPGISPTLLAKRLKEMQDSGLLERVEDLLEVGGAAAGRDLEVQLFGAERKSGGVALVDEEVGE